MQTPTFRTQVSPQPSTQPIYYEDKLLLIGSCFTENIGKQLKNLQFQTQVNPQGIVFNPISIAKSLTRMIENRNFQADELHETQGLWFSYEHHSSFSQLSQAACLQGIQSVFDTSRQGLQQTDFLLLTFGTAWVYERKQTSEIVANCHKVPQYQFRKRLLSVQEIVAQYKTLIPQLLAYCPHLRQIIFTISPVRHWKDGVVENQQSKATLQLALREIAQIFPQLSHYFPAYEIMLDDLRDYRFYEADMLHPNEVAIQYIWQAFQQAHIAPACYPIIADVQKINTALAHRPFQPQSESHKSYLQNVQNKIKKLQANFPFMKFG
ncbi:MAG: GSCFA domain-containing protein, partial [Bacteroidia bacterium]